MIVHYRTCTQVKPFINLPLVVTFFATYMILRYRTGTQVKPFINLPLVVTFFATYMILRYRTGTQVKPFINLVEDHPQLIHKGHSTNGALVGVGSFLPNIST